MSCWLTVTSKIFLERGTKIILENNKLIPPCGSEKEGYLWHKSNRRFENANKNILDYCSAMRDMNEDNIDEIVEYFEEFSKHNTIINGLYKIETVTADYEDVTEQYWYDTEYNKFVDIEIEF